MQKFQSDKFSELQTIMNDLREKCPWDKKQTIQTLRNLTVEEVYELVEEIDAENFSGIKEELGDVLLHIVFYAKIAEEKGEFTLNDVLTDLNEKLIRRHPHVYGDISTEDEEEIKKNWQKIKLSEKPQNKSILGGVPKNLPPLLKSYRVQSKASEVGFDWKNSEEVFGKIKEELQELEEATEKKDDSMIAEELGDVFFTLINFSRKRGLDPEVVLSKSCNKFIERFKIMETIAKKEKKSFIELPPEEKEMLWETAKKQKLK